MDREYPWYDIVKKKGELIQGDFIEKCPILVPLSLKESEITDNIDVCVRNYNVIIMSQSCDLIYENVDLVLVCPVRFLTELEEESDFYRSKKGKEALKQGYSPGYHLLNKCEIDGFIKGYLVVDFRNVYGVPFPLLQNLAASYEKRLRLLPPYREHLSQAFARFFMRVGLPVDISFPIPP